ncbi:hypothetical protein D3C76_749410 [compost metagenome]|uniref:Uncharacterized protein n=1 Tax=Pseudomonas jinjuensis TaxID=198616 RepID=A0A1H0JRN0_9PSED|nr:hypothetical protein [Pseudomonas jinjuensis]SDO46347.1 hypothetical protein SAMN05216193_111179 [Pseudomonas jinjuensis]
MSNHPIDPWFPEVHHPFINDELIPLLTDYMTRNGYPPGAVVAAVFMSMVTSAYACGQSFTELERMMAFAWQCADQAEGAAGRVLQ